MEKVCVCCRGKSLKSISLVPEVDSFVIANGFTEEMQIPGLSDAFGNKPITHVFTNVTYQTKVLHQMVPQQFYTKYNVTSIISPYTKEVGNRGYTVQGRDGIIPFSHYPDELKPYMWYDETAKYKWDFPSCGNGAVLYGAAVATKELHIIGLDFFLEGAHGYASGARMTAKGHDGLLMKKFLVEQVFEIFTDVQFYIYTCATIDTTLPNVKVIRVEQ